LAWAHDMFSRFEVELLICLGVWFLGFIHIASQYHFKYTFLIPAVGLCLMLDYGFFCPAFPKVLTFLIV